MDLADLDLPALRFQTSDEARPALEAACAAHPDLARCDTIGNSEEGGEIIGVTLGRGPRRVTLVAGAHADEPVGPETLRALVVAGLAARDRLAPLFERLTFRIIPHVNPDGEGRNRAWIAQWPDLAAYLIHRQREPPGRDVEFGYPALRPENVAASHFLFDGEPVALHMSLHGMGFAEGALLLIERRWADRVEALKAAWLDATAQAGLRPHDQDRRGDKGFLSLGPGFWTTPEGAAMRAHFRAAGDPATAALFHDASMEWAIRTGRDPGTGQTPLCLVTELPLFVLAAPYEHTPGVPALYDRFQAALPALTLAARRGESMAPLVESFGVRPLDLETAVRLQLHALDLGLEAVGESQAGSATVPVSNEGA